MEIVMKPNKPMNITPKTGMVYKDAKNHTIFGLMSKPYEVVEIGRETDELTYSKVIYYKFQYKKGQFLKIDAKDVLELS